MRMILQDRYCGTYSGGLYIVVEDYYKPLTQEELNLVNPHIADTDAFYGPMLERRGYEPRDYTLKLGATRADYVQKTFQGSDCYAAGAHRFEWIYLVNNLKDV